MTPCPTVQGHLRGNNDNNNNNNNNNNDNNNEIYEAPTPWLQTLNNTDQNVHSMKYRKNKTTPPKKIFAVCLLVDMYRISLF